MRRYREVKEPAFFALDELPEFEALARIEEHTHNMEKALGLARSHYAHEQAEPMPGAFPSQEWLKWERRLNEIEQDLSAALAALSAGEGTPA